MTRDEAEELAQAIYNVAKTTHYGDGLTVRQQLCSLLEGVLSEKTVRMADARAGAVINAIDDLVQAVRPGRKSQEKLRSEARGRLFVALTGATSPPKEETAPARLQGPRALAEEVATEVVNKRASAKFAGRPFAATVATVEAAIRERDKAWERRLAWATREKRTRQKQSR